MSHDRAAFVSVVMRLPVVLLDMRMSITSMPVMVSHLRFAIIIRSRVFMHAVGERALEQLNYSLIKNRAWCVETET